MSNRTVPATAEGMPEDVTEFTNLVRELSLANRAKVRELMRRLRAEERA